MIMFFCGFMWFFDLTNPSSTRVFELESCNFLHKIILCSLNDLEEILLRELLLSLNVHCRRYYGNYIKVH